jgi:hypothetical protein
VRLLGPFFFRASEHVQVARDALGRRRERALRASRAARRVGGEMGELVAVAEALFERFVARGVGAEHFDGDFLGELAVDAAG